LKNVLGERETLQLAGTIDIDKPGLGSIASARRESAICLCPVRPYQSCWDSSIDRRARTACSRRAAASCRTSATRIHGSKITLYKVVP
jgi:hypothetical protein